MYSVKIFRYLIYTITSCLKITDLLPPFFVSSPSSVFPPPSSSCLSSLSSLPSLYFPSSPFFFPLLNLSFVLALLPLPHLSSFLLLPSVSLPHLSSFPLLQSNFLFPVLHLSCVTFHSFLHLWPLFSFHIKLLGSGA